MTAVKTMPASYTKAARPKTPGKVYLVGAGPGDPELLTLKAMRLLRTADAVLHDDLVASEILELIPPTAQVHNVGKRCGTKKVRQEEINFLMITLAGSGLEVVRLKSGDPLIFGRAGEEIEALAAAGIPYEIVPGITSALGAAAASTIPLTRRGASSALVFLTAHQAEGSAERSGRRSANGSAGGNEDRNWVRLAGSGATLVIYMPGQNYSEIAAKLKRAGLANDMPCAIISQATTRHQQAHRTTIDGLSRTPHLASPTLLIIGKVVGHAGSLPPIPPFVGANRFIGDTTVGEESIL